MIGPAPALARAPSHVARHGCGRGRDYHFLPCPAGPRRVLDRLPGRRGHRPLRTPWSARITASPARAPIPAGRRLALVCLAEIGGRSHAPGAGRPAGIRGRHSPGRTSRRVSVPFRPDVKETGPDANGSNCIGIDTSETYRPAALSCTRRPESRPAARHATVRGRHRAFRFRADRSTLQRAPLAPACPAWCGCIRATMIAPSVQGRRAPCTFM